MQILPVSEIRKWDSFTIRNEPVASIDLMERAASACIEWILKNYPSQKHFSIFSGNGNNGGDGLAIARILASKEFNVEVYLISETGSEDFNTNLERLKNAGIRYTVLKELPVINSESVIIDALLGTGVNKAVEGFIKELILHLNQQDTKIISIDIPSGLDADDANPADHLIAIRADRTITFQAPKYSFLFRESYQFTGDWEVLDIRLHPLFVADDSFGEFITENEIRNKMKVRSKHDYKGTFGHTLLIAGSHGKAGAAVLATKAAVYSGSGLTTANVPSGISDILQISVPEAMVISDADEKNISEEISFDKYTSIAIGPGLGTSSASKKLLYKYFNTITQALVIDADGLNILADFIKENPSFKFKNPAILTPHIGEFRRLSGESNNSSERLEMQKEFSKKINAFVALKGANTSITTPEGKVYFNSSGSPALATGGTGDILTGIIASLLAQGYDSEQAVTAGVYLHGRAAELAVKDLRQNIVPASLLFSYISQAIQIVSS